MGAGLRVTGFALHKGPEGVSQLVEGFERVPFHERFVSAQGSTPKPQWQNVCSEDPSLRASLGRVPV